MQDNSKVYSTQYLRMSLGYKSSVINHGNDITIQPILIFYCFHSDLPSVPKKLLCLGTGFLASLEPTQILLQQQIPESGFSSKKKECLVAHSRSPRRSPPWSSLSPGMQAHAHLVLACRWGIAHWRRSAQGADHGVMCKGLPQGQQWARLS